jgi:lipoate-protein ligase A
VVGSGVKLDHEWRLVDSGLVDGPTSQAIDEAIRVARLGEKVPNTLHLYRRRPPTASIGRYQRLEDVVDLVYCSERGIDVIRRTSGGGAIYTDAHCVEYAVVVDQAYPAIPGSLDGSFKVICAGIILALQTLGLDATYKPINDVLVRGRKISGSAQRRRRILLQHGTLLVDADFDAMNRALRGGDGGVVALMERLTTVRREARRVIPVDEVAEALKRGFEEVLAMKLVKGELTPWEERQVEELAEQYRSPTWIRTGGKKMPN